MFNTISWQTYFTAILCLTVGYYSITALLFYAREIIQRIKSGSFTSSTPLSHQQERQEDNTAAIIGAATPTPLSSAQPMLASDEVILVASDEVAPDIIHSPSASPESLIVGSVSDLLNEIKTLVLLCEEYKSDKEECIALFTASFLKYPHLKGTTYQQAITAYVCEEGKDHLSFIPKLDEVRQWWG